MNNKYILESLSMDLKRVAIGYQRKSFGMAQRFYEEALKRKEELDKTSLQRYMIHILDTIEDMKNKDAEYVSERALMYSTLIQNYTKKFI
jgi:polysaccharide pyruvyl transferase WcaK-like protein